MRKPINYWTKEKCQEEALKYNNKISFIKNSSKAYYASIRLNCLSEITEHMIRPEAHNKIWTKEKCQEVALKYNSRISFHKKSGAAYVSAHTNNWLNEICEHMSRPISYNKKWNKDTCRIEALKYNTRKEFNDKSKGAYLAAIKLGIIDDICLHMKICGNLVKRCIYVYEFSDNYAYVGLTYNYERRHSQHLKHVKSPIYKHIKESGLLPKHFMISDGYIDVFLAKILEKEFYNIYLTNGWNMLNSNKTGGTGWCKLPF